MQHDMTLFSVFLAFVSYRFNVIYLSLPGAGPAPDQCNDVCWEWDYNWGCNISWYSHLQVQNFTQRIVITIDCFKYLNFSPYFKSQKLGKYNGPADIGPFPGGAYNGYYGQLVLRLQLISLPKIAQFLIQAYYKNSCYSHQGPKHSLERPKLGPTICCRWYILEYKH